MGHRQGKYIIGITGNIATGKSLVRKMLEHKGAYTIDADGLAHQVMAPKAPAFRPVVEWFGRWIIGEDGRIDRNRLGTVAFSHQFALKKLEQITHPIIGKAIDTLITRSQHKIIVVEAIKLLEGDLAQKVDTIWVVDSEPKTQLVRLMKKRGLSQDEAVRRIRVQSPQSEKIEKANVVITNNGDVNATWAQVQAEWDKVVAQLQPAAPAPAPAPTPPPAPPVSAPAAAQPVPASPAPQAQQAPPPVSTPASDPTIPRASIPADGLNVHRPKREDLAGLADLFNKAKGTDLTETDIMLSFTETSYLVAEYNGKMVGAVGFVVENLITQSSDIVVLPGVTVAPVVEGLITSMEEASQSLQSEVSFVYLNQGRDVELINLFKSKLGYEETELEDISFTAWREAIRASQPADTSIYSKKLREDRVLTPF